MSFSLKSPGRGCRRPISQVYATFELLQGCLAVGGSLMTGNDVTRLEVTGSDPEVT